jgi:hypothetical protein
MPASPVETRCKSSPLFKKTKCRDIKNLIDMKQMQAHTVNVWTKKKSNMKKAYLVLFTSLIAAASYGQSVQRVVINSTGGMISAPGSSVRMTLSVAEPIIGNVSSAGINMGQGFLGGSKTVAAAPSGIQDVTTENTNVYPNPFSHIVKINSDADNINVAVFNILGEQVYAGAYQPQGIDLSHLNTGLYILQASSNNKIISTTKLLKQ